MEHIKTFSEHPKFLKSIKQAGLPGQARCKEKGEKYALIQWRWKTEGRTLLQASVCVNTGFRLMGHRTQCGVALRA